MIQTSGKTSQKTFSRAERLCLLDAFRLRIPKTDVELQAYCWAFFDKFIPAKSFCEGHCSPFNYLASSYFGKHNHCVVWANRAGGKTLLGAVAALLDAIHRPQCATRVLGGSLEQADRMYEHCKAGLGCFEDALAGDVMQRKTRFKNGSNIEIFAASQKSVRGSHVPRLKIDEVDEIDAEVYQAALFVSQSTSTIPAITENFSTMHRPSGLMAEVIDNTDTLFKWCLWETIEKCVDRSCSQCKLADDCKGRAKEAEGYIRIDDAIKWKRSVSKAMWEAESLCLRPSVYGVIFPEFQAETHINGVQYDPNLPLYRAIDWGYNYFCCLWIQPTKDAEIRVIAEYKGEQKALPQNIEAIHATEKQFQNGHKLNGNIRSYVDPAGKARNDQTGKQNIQIMQEAGIKCDWVTASRWRNVVNGLNLIRDYLMTGDGTARLMISNKCPWLIDSFKNYAWKRSDNVPLDEPEQNTPWEHPMDALRYYFVNRHAPSGVRFY